jgi:hypothetical protein
MMRGDKFMTTSIAETYIKMERYSILAKALECTLNSLGYNLKIEADTELKDVGRGPQTFVNFKFTQE